MRSERTPRNRYRRSIGIGIAGLVGLAFGLVSNLLDLPSGIVAPGSLVAVVLCILLIAPWALCSDRMERPSPTAHRFHLVKLWRDGDLIVSVGNEHTFEPEGSIEFDRADTVHR